MDEIDPFEMPPHTELIACPWRMFQTAFEVICCGQLRAVIAQGTDGMWSVWHPAGKYVSGHIPVQAAAAHAALDIEIDRVCIPGIEL
jgi:hypothetical protein